MCLHVACHDSYRARSKRVCNKEIGATKLRYHDFLFALQRIAEKKEVALKSIIEKVIEHGRYRREHTMADFVVLNALGEQ